MPLFIVKNDITAMKVDAIVNAANPTLLGGGGVDGCIHRAAGPRLREECATLGGCETGHAKLTGAYGLPCRFVIHTVGPVWQGGTQNEEAQLHGCYLRSLQLAEENGCETVAFPLISAGAYGYPRREAFTIAVNSIRMFLEHAELTVYLVIYDDRAGLLEEGLLEALRHCFAVEAEEPRHSLLREDKCSDFSAGPRFSALGDYEDTLRRRLRDIDESFSQMLLRKIDEKGWTDAQCYKKANIDRKLFSKIRGNVHYRPSKTTAVAFAIALELPFEEADELLSKAGFTLSDSQPFDVIVKFFISIGHFDVLEINRALFTFDQPLLGG